MQIYFRITKQSQKIVSRISAKQTGEKIFLLLLSQLKKTTKKSPYTFLERALLKLEPGIKLVPKVRRGKTTYIPKYLKKAYRVSLNWLLDGANYHKKNIPFINRLTSEILTTLQDKSVALNLRDEFLDFVEDCFLLMKRRFKRYLSLKRYRRKKKKLMKKLYKLIGGRKKRRIGKKKIRKKKRKLTLKKKMEIFRYGYGYKVKLLVKLLRKIARKKKQKLYKKTGKEKYKFQFIRYSQISPKLTDEQLNRIALKIHKRSIKKRFSRIEKYFWKKTGFPLWKKINKLKKLVLKKKVKKTMLKKEISKKNLKKLKKLKKLKELKKKVETKNKITKTINFIFKTTIPLWLKKLEKITTKKTRIKKKNLKLKKIKTKTRIKKRKLTLKKINLKIAKKEKILKEIDLNYKSIEIPRKIILYNNIKFKNYYNKEDKDFIGKGYVDPEELKYEKNVKEIKKINKINNIKKLIKLILKRKTPIWEKLNEILGRRKKRLKALLYKLNEKIKIKKELLLYKLKKIQLKNNKINLLLIKKHTEYNKLILLEEKLKNEQKRLEHDNKHLKKIALNGRINLEKNFTKFFYFIRLLNIICWKNIKKRNELIIERKYIQKKQEINRYNYSKNKLNYNKNMVTYLEIIKNEKNK